VTRCGSTAFGTEIVFGQTSRRRCAKENLRWGFKERDKIAGFEQPEEILSNQLIHFKDGQAN
jgi:hypothetical protein